MSYLQAEPERQLRGGRLLRHHPRHPGLPGDGQRAADQPRPAQLGVSPATLHPRSNEYKRNVLTWLIMSSTY